MGITKGKWGTLIDALFDFKNAYDDAAALDDLLPGFGPAGVTLPEFCDRAHAALRDSDLDTLFDQVFTDLPEPVLTPSDCHGALIRGGTESVGLDDLPDRVSATTIVVTPPGIPMLMPGEAAGPADGPLMTYLRALESFDVAFPDLATEIHGAHRRSDGHYHVEVIAH
nr:hypothetical protein [Actinomadura sp. WMMB 499]